MKKVIIIFACVIGVLIAGIGSMFVFQLCPPQGPWPMPPWCKTPRIAIGERTIATFFVSVPYNTPSEDIILLAIEGREPIKMNKLNEISWQVDVPVKGGDKISYKYLRNTQDSYSSTQNIIITKRNQKIYDGVSGWSDLPFIPNFPKNFVMAVSPMDTWGRNYNFNWFEDTRKNIESCFERIRKIKSKEVYVYDFYMAVFDNETADWTTDINYQIKPDVFENDFRDEAMTQEDLNKLASTAHEKGMKIGWRASLTFVNIGKYIGVEDIAAEVEKDRKKFVSTKRDEKWIKDFFAKWQSLMLDRAEALNKAGFDIMIITPSWHTPRFHPNEELANDLWKDLIKSVKQKFNGKVGIVVDRYGYLNEKVDNEDWSKYDYYKEADLVYYFIYYLPGKYKVNDNPSIAEMKEGFDKFFDDLENIAKKDNIKLSLMVGIQSFENSVNYEGFIEFYDFKNPKVKAVKKDWQHQADVFEAILQALEGRTAFEKITFIGYWWDDAMDPDVKPRISISISFRNKPAEGVFEKWAFSMK